jgi:hypothetical protein
MKNYKLPSSDHILAEAGGETLGFGVNKHINSI